MKTIIAVIFLTCFACSAFAGGSCVTREDTPVAGNKSDFLQMIRLESAGNTRAITQMGSEGRLFVAPGGQRVQRISVDGRLAKITVNGNSGWTFNSFLICR
ncbi:MAG: hypothetical protein PHN92_06125 [Geobacter sp.]|nr:hypothetical protein [Geobacter sp.]